MQTIIYHITVSLEDQLSWWVGPVFCYLCPLASCTQEWYLCSFQLLYLSCCCCLCLVWIFFFSQLLSDMLSSIIYPCTCCFGESAACWSAANMDFCFSWSVLECERERPQEGNSGFLHAHRDCQCFQLVHVRMSAQQPATPFSGVLWKKGCAMRRGTPPCFLGLTAARQFAAELSACLRNLEVLIKLKVSYESSLMW